MKDCREPKKLRLATTGFAALAGPAVTGLLIGIGLPAIRAQSPISIPPATRSDAPQTTTPPKREDKQANTATHLNFDVASVKTTSPNRPDGRIIVGMAAPIGGPGSSSPGRIHYPAISLKLLLMNAYLLTDSRIVGPGWLDTEFFQIDATMPPSTTMEQFRMMLQSLLIDRFNLKIHSETKDLPGYALVVSKSGSKMKKSVEASVPQDDGPAERPKIGEDGFPIWNLKGRVGIFNFNGPRGTRLTAQQQTMHDLTNYLAAYFKQPVLDETALTAKYDFTLTFSREGSADLSAADTLPEILTAVQLQLGLKLESKKVPTEVMAIDHIEKTPTKN